jgi:hypothetical protein
MLVATCSDCGSGVEFVIAEKTATPIHERCMECDALYKLNVTRLVSGGDDE